MRTDDNRMNPKHQWWDVFVELLTNQQGVKLEQAPDGGIKWQCTNDENLPLTMKILGAMHGVDAIGSRAYFHSEGAFCDCEVLWNLADPGVTQILAGAARMQKLG